MNDDKIDVAHVVCSVYLQLATPMAVAIAERILMVV